MTSELADVPPRSLAFGSFVLIPERQLLLENEAPVRIGGRALDILTALVERPGELVSKNELVARVWPDTVVEDGNLKVNMAALRRVLGDGSGPTQYIATVIGRGYRFVAPVRAVGYAASAFTTGAASARNHNLPASATRIFGRVEAIAALGRDLADCRLLSIVGAGGIGKTTVGLAIAERAVPSYKNGVWLVDLAPLKDPALMPNAIATAIGLTAHSASMLAALCEYLRDRELLLVLDSCEHLVDAAAACADRVLAEAPFVKLLVTSREPLGAKGERVRRLPELGTPPAAAVLDAKAALAFPSIQLFVDRATERLESFTFNDVDAPVVADICRKLDGLALAIELAATRVDAFSVNELREQLADRLSLLKGPRASVARHRTLSATIHWSYDLLPESERLLMRRLSIFAGTFNLASACAVGSGAGVDRASVVEGLASLVAKSLVATEAGDLEVEYRQLDTTRSYALEKLVANDEFDSARQRHAAHFLELSLQAKADCDKLTREHWLGRYGAKIDDIRDALRWAFAGQETANLSVMLTVAAIPFWSQLSLVEECRAAVERALDDRLARHRSERDDLILNLTLGASLLHTRGPLLAVKSALTTALAIAEKLHDTNAQLECLRGLSEYELWTGDSHSALAVAEKIRALASRERIKAGGDADAPAGSALSYIGDLGASRRHLENIVNRPIHYSSSAHGARFELDQRLTTRGTLAAVLWLQGFPDQALEMARCQREEAAASHSAVSLCYALLHGSTVISLYVHDLEAVGRFIDLSVAHATKHGLTVWRDMATCVRGRWLLNSGRPFDFVAYRKALTELHEGGFRMRYANYLTNYGEALARHGDFESGLAYIDEALALATDRKQFLGIPEMLRIKGDALRLQDAGSRKAEACYFESLDWARRQGALSWELRTAMSLVELRRATGGDEQAEAMLSSVLGRFSEGFGTGDLLQARALLERAPKRPHGARPDGGR